MHTDPELQAILEPYTAAMAEFGEGLPVQILIVEAGDTLAQVEQACGQRLVADSRFTLPVEAVTEHARWIEALWITSDDGAGLVLLIDKGGDPSLLAACRAALADSTSWP